MLMYIAHHCTIVHYAPLYLLSKKRTLRTHICTNPQPNQLLKIVMIPIEALNKIANLLNIFGPRSLSSSVIICRRCRSFCDCSSDLAYGPLGSVEIIHGRSPLFPQGAWELGAAPKRRPTWATWLSRQWFGGTPFSDCLPWKTELRPKITTSMPELTIQNDRSIRPP